MIPYGKDQLYTSHLIADGLSFKYGDLLQEITAFCQTIHMARPKSAKGKLFDIPPDLSPKRIMQYVAVTIDPALVKSPNIFFDNTSG